MKRLIPVVLCLVILGCSILPANAIEVRSSAKPVLSFSGTEAQCSFTYTEIGCSINVTLSLWNGSTLLDSWSESGTSYVSISESCPVESGKTYTLKVSGTCDSKTIMVSPVTKTCS